jgi:predicted transposase/invertase (TIGR01784 family)
VYANLLSKIGRFLEHGHVNQDWVAIVIYPNRAMEQKNLRPYRWLFQSDQLIRVFLDELPAALPDQFEMGILELIAAKPELALNKAQAMVPRIRRSKRPADFQRLVLQLLETVLLAQFPKLSREEIEKMVHLADLRETRVFQEALEEGEEKGLEKGREEALVKVVIGMLNRGDSIAEIEEVTELTPIKIRAIKKKHIRKR